MGRLRGSGSRESRPFKAPLLMTSSERSRVLWWKRLGRSWSPIRPAVSRGLARASGSCSRLVGVTELSPIAWANSAQVWGVGSRESSWFKAPLLTMSSEMSRL